MEDKTQKEKIRDDREERFRKDFRAGLFKNLLTGLENPFEIEKWWLNELDLAIKETEDRIVSGMEVILGKYEAPMHEDGSYSSDPQFNQVIDAIRQDFINLIRNK
jgi:hypothetical protein